MYSGCVVRWHPYRIWPLFLHELTCVPSEARCRLLHNTDMLAWYEFPDCYFRFYRALLILSWWGYCYAGQITFWLAGGGSTLASASEASPLRNLNRPGFPGDCFICELRLPDHRFWWKHNKLFLLLPEGYDPAFPAIVDCYTSPPTLVWPVPLLSGFSSYYGVLPPLCKDHWCSPPSRCHTSRLCSLLMPVILLP